MKRIRFIYIFLTMLLLGTLATSVVAQSAKLLPETYVSDDESMTLRYPTGWVIDSEQPGLVIVATSEDILDIGNETIPSGEAAVAVLFSSADDEYLREYFSGSDSVTVLDNIIKTLFSDASDINVEFTAPESITFADYPAARAQGIFLDNRVLLIVVDRGGDVFSLVIGISAESDFAKYEPKLLAIAESVNFLPPTAE